jgi:hypothetical protein
LAFLFLVEALLEQLTEMLGLKGFALALLFEVEFVGFESLPFLSGGLLATPGGSLFVCDVLAHGWQYGGLVSSVKQKF